MVKANPESLFRVYRFTATFGFDEDRPELILPGHIAAMTPRGLEFWRGIRSGEMLIDVIGMATTVKIELISRDDQSKRVIMFNVTNPHYLPFGVGIELGGQRVGRLDATVDEVALEGVVFDVTKTTITDTVVDKEPLEYIRIDFSKFERRVHQVQNQEKVEDLPFPKARRTMAKALHDDEGLRLGYVANVAMLLHDRYGITDHKTRNEAAEAILALIFENKR